MFPMLCEACNKPLDFDYQASLDEYLLKVDYINKSVDYSCDLAINSPLLYVCSNCSKTFKYTLKQVEAKVKDTVFKDVMQYRKRYVFREIYNMGVINPDSGMVSCGLCAGIDNEGNCYADIKKVCPLVKNDI